MSVKEKHYEVILKINGEKIEHMYFFINKKNGERNRKGTTMESGGRREKTKRGGWRKRRET